MYCNACIVMHVCSLYVYTRISMVTLYSALLLFLNFSLLHWMMLIKVCFFAQLGFSVSRVADKKVQLNTDLLKHRDGYLYTNWWHDQNVNEKVNEIKRAKLKVGEFNLGWRLNLQTLRENHEPIIFRSFSKIYKLWVPSLYSAQKLLWNINREML